MIEVNHLYKQYGGHTAVSDLSFTIDKGHIYGFLGPNGAGKSTTMNIMTGCLAATSGTVTVDGHDIYEEAAEAKKLIGYLPEIPPLYLDRTPREYLTFVARAKKVPAKSMGEEIDRVMEITQITRVGDRLMKHLSKGYKQRVGIAQAILGDPEIIILDEPTVGLDPKQIIEIRELITELGKNHTVVLSSHILSEVSAVCDTIMIISGGQLVACDTPENLEKMFSGSASVSLVCDGTAEEAEAILADVRDITVSERENFEGKCAVKTESSRDDTDEICREIFRAFAGAGKCIISMNAVKASLEDIFLELTGTDVAVNDAESHEEYGADSGEEAEDEGYEGSFFGDGYDDADYSVESEEDNGETEDNEQ